MVNSFIVYISIIEALISKGHKSNTIRLTSKLVFLISDTIIKLRKHTRCSYWPSYDRIKIKNETLRSVSPIQLILIVYFGHITQIVTIL